MKRRSISALALMLSVAMCGCTVVEQLPDATTETAYVQDISAIRAQDDFYGYINASYLNGIDVSDSSGYAGSFESIDSVIDSRLDEIIHSIASGDRASYQPGSNEQLIYDLYYQTLSASTSGEMMSDADVAAFEAVCASILSVSTVDEYISLLGTLYMDYGVAPVFDPVVMSDLKASGTGAIVVQPFTDPLGISLQQLVINGTNAQNCANAICGILVKLGVDADEASDRGIAATNMMMDIGYGTDLELVNMLTENPDDVPQYILYLDSSEIDSLCPNVGSAGILSTMGFAPDSVAGLYVIDESQLSLVDSLLTSENLEAWKDIALLSFANSLTDILPASYSGTGIVYSNDTFALRAVKRFLADELGEEYVELYYDESTVEDVTSIAYAVRDEYVSLIADCSWMSDEGKALVTEKLLSMTFYIGAPSPHEVSSADASLVGSSCYETYSNMHRKHHEMEMSILDGTGGRTGFQNMPPQTVNACYLTMDNAMVIPLGIMDAPFYDPAASYYTNLGGIGAVIGHEISHAFDHNGMNYDPEGNYAPDWIPQADRDNFETVSAAFVDYYSSYTVMTYRNVDGDLTLSENMADAAGLECVLRLAPSLSSKQEVFEAFARIFATVTTRDNMISQLYNDAHSPEIVRINATVALFDEFYEIYDVQEGDLMYVPASDRVRRW